MTEYRLSRFELDEINTAYEKLRAAPENSSFREHAEAQLKKIDLPINVSRFSLAEKIREIEKNIGK